ncbi:MAG: DMT family transporter [Clostridia bacterium]|nr:DMT family transporter [Clostridia bacterium]MBQ7302937.1 DMT family transporter [Clostridia bacterium]
MKSKQTQGMLAALATNLIFGFSFLFSKMAIAVAHPLTVLAVRFTVAFAALNILWLCGAAKPRFRGKKYGRLLLMSVAQPLCYFVLELYGISLTSSALSGIIIALVPVAVALICAFLPEKPNGKQYLCAAVSLAGIIAISLLAENEGENKLLGIVLLAGAVIAAAAFNLLSRREAAAFSPFERTYVMFLIGTVGFHGIAFAAQRETYITELQKAAVSPTFWVAILYLAVVSSVAAFMLYNFATSHISAVRSASFSNIIPVISVLAGVFIMDEPFSLWEILLCIPVLLGVWGVNRFGETKA